MRESIYHHFNNHQDNNNQEKTTIVVVVVGLLVGIDDQLKRKKGKKIGAFRVSFIKGNWEEKSRVCSNFKNMSDLNKHFQPKNFGNGRATIYFLVLVEVHLKFQKLCIETLGFDIWIQLPGFDSLDSTAR